MQIALGLKQLGDDVLLTTTDPANHLNTHLAEHAGIEMAVIDWPTNIWLVPCS